MDASVEEDMYNLKVLDEPDEKPKKVLKTADRKLYNKMYMREYNSREDTYTVCKQCLEKYRRSALKKHMESKKHLKAVKISENLLNLFNSA